MNIPVAMKCYFGECLVAQVFLQVPAICSHAQSYWICAELCRAEAGVYMGVDNTTNLGGEGGDSVSVAINSNY